MSTIENSEFPVPSTISDDAKEAIAMFTREAREMPMPKPDDHESWLAARAGVEETFAPMCEMVVKQYEPQIENRTLGGVAVLDIKPKNWQTSRNILVYTHGGAYTLFSSRSTLTSSVPVAADTGLRVISIDYSLAPEANWNQITDEVVTVIEALIKEGHDLKNIAIYGDSAGGGLAAGSVLKMRDSGMGMPAAVTLWSPWSDITETGDTYETLKDADPLLRYADKLKHSADAYASPADQKNPYVSPVYGDYSKGFPPTLIQCGTKEIFLSNAIRHYQVLDAAGVTVKLDPYEGMYHVFQLFHWNLPESNVARGKMKSFLQTYLQE